MASLFRRNNDTEEIRTSPGGNAGTGVVPPARTTVPDSNLALSVGSVYRCASILANSVSQLPMEVRRGMDLVESPLAERPDPNSTAKEFWEQTMLSLVFRGNAYWWVTNSQDGKVMALTPLNPSRVNMRVQETRGWINGKPIYSIDGKDIQARNIKHLTIFRRPGEHLGMSPLQAGASDIETAYLIKHYGDSILSNGSIPSGVLSTDQFLNGEQANAYRDAWNEAQKVRGLAVLGNGMKYDAIQLSPKDMMFLESQQFSVAQVARLFGIPAVWLNLGIDGSSLTYANVEDLARNYLQITLSTYLNSIEQAFTDLLPRTQQARFKLDALLRANLAGRVDQYEKLIPLGVMSAEEARLSEGMTIPDGAVTPPPLLDGAPQ